MVWSAQTQILARTGANPSTDMKVSSQIVYLFLMLTKIKYIFTETFDQICNDSPHTHLRTREQSHWRIQAAKHTSAGLITSNTVDLNTYGMWSLVKVKETEMCKCS